MMDEHKVTRIEQWSDRPPPRLEVDQPLWLASLIAATFDNHGGTTVQHEPVIFTADDRDEATAYASELAAQRYPDPAERSVAIVEIDPKLRLVTIHWPE